MTRLVVFFILVLVSLNCLAHSRWIVPSHTVISGAETSAVAFDMSISNDIFHPDNPYGGVPPSAIENGTTEADNKEPLHPLAEIAKSTRLQVTMPDGSVDLDSKIINLGRKSVSAFELAQNGTYRFDLIQKPIVFTTFKTNNDGHGRLFGKLEDVKSKLPDGARDVKEVNLLNRVRTYVSRNAPTQKNIAPLSRGLDIKFGAHPNDLFANEPASVRLLMDGEPLADTEIKITQAGTRFRNNRNVITITTDKKGNGLVSWPEAGLFLLEVEVEVANSSSDKNLEMHTLYVTLEVFPE